MHKQVLLIRHGETEWNAKRRWQGHTDVPLNARGIQQAESLADELQYYALDALFSSNLARAYQTAKIVSEPLELPVFTSDGLREVDVGSAEGLGYEETVTLFGEESIARWRSLLPEDLEFSFPEGETKLEALLRTRRAIEGFLHSNELRKVGVISHGMVIRTFLNCLFPHLDLPTVLPNCGYVSLSWGAGEDAWSLNDGVTGDSILVRRHMVFLEG